MADLYIGVNGQPKRVKNIYIGVNGIPKQVKQGYIGVNGVPKLFYNNSIPSTYQKVEYIYNTGGTQYIDTGIKPNSDTYVFLEFELSSADYNTLFGVPVGSTSSSMYGMSISSNPGKFYIAFNEALNSHMIGTASVNTRYKVEFNKSGGKFYLNGTLVYSSTTTFSNSANKGMILFGYAQTGTYQPVPSAQFLRVYHFQAWQSGVMIRDMYPCYLKSNTQTVGMYDIIGNQFYSNSGTGIFYKGPDVN